MFLYNKDCLIKLPTFKTTITSKLSSCGSTLPFNQTLNLWQKNLILSKQTYKSFYLTCIPELFVPKHRENDEHIPQDVNHNSEDQHAGQRCGHSDRGALCTVAGILGQTIHTTRVCLQIHVNQNAIAIVKDRWLIREL